MTKIGEESDPKETGVAHVNQSFEPDSSHDVDAIEPPSSNDVIKVSSLQDFDDLLPYIGDFGLYQKILFLLTIPYMFSVAFVYFTTIFLTLSPDNYWCHIPELSHLSVQDRLQLAIPKNEKCHQYVANFTKMLQNNIKMADTNWSQVPCQYGWEYDLSDIRYKTITTELNWVCSRETYASISQAIFFVGAICGGLIFGWIADFYGRLPALIITNFIGFSVGIITAFVNSFVVFCLSRFLIGLAFDNCFTMMYIISILSRLLNVGAFLDPQRPICNCLEYVGSKYRTFVANMSIAVFFTIATCLLPWIAVYLSNWRYLTIVTSVPSLCGILIAMWMVPESARWLISKGEFGKAVTIMKKIAKVNKMQIADKIFLEFTENSKRQHEKISLSNSTTYSFLDLFKSPRLRRITLLLILIWMSISLVFDGHVRNVGALGSDFFLTFTIACATEFPADTFLTLVLDRWGRRWLAFATMALSGLFSLLSTLVPTGVTSASFAIMGRLAVNISYNIGLQYAAEVLPTVVRAQGVSVVHLMGYVACIIAPFIVLLSKINSNIPLIILGCLGIFGGTLSLFLPETLNKDMPQTLEDGENFGIDQQFWSFPCCGGPTTNEIGDNLCRFRRVDGEAAYLSSSRISFRGAIRSSKINRGRSKKSFDLHK